MLQSTESRARSKRKHAAKPLTSCTAPFVILRDQRITGTAARINGTCFALRCDVDFLAHTVGDVFWPNPEVCDLVPRLSARYRILLGSNTNALHARRFLKQFANVFRHFNHLVLSYEIGLRKPDADFYHTCLRS